MTIAFAGDAEWLEADGLGGFALGTASGTRTRRYHALLLAATTPPTGRVVLVNGLEVWVEDANGTFALSSQRYAPDVTHPDGASRIEAFDPEPWPRWIYRLENGVRIEHELFAPHGASACMLRWRLVADDDAEARSSVAQPVATPSNDTPAQLRGSAAGRLRLHVRPLISGRDYHSLHHENSAFRFDAFAEAQRVAWRPYDGLPAVVALHNARYEQRPEWYRNFQYDRERERGLDFTEDLASPGVFTWDLGGGEAVLMLAAEGHAANAIRVDEGAEACAARLAKAERTRREEFRSRLDRAADAYVVRRGTGSTIVAGYPWFTDWGRDTFIALRGLCIATGRLADARAILLEWASTVSDGMLPNRFPDGRSAPEYNAVDASLWYVIAVHDYLAEAKRQRHRIPVEESRALAAAVEAILDGYERGTRYRIHCDGDALLAAGEAGVQLTWMDAKIGDWVVTPRIGKPVEVQALWINALRIGATVCARASHWRELAERATESFRRRFWNHERDCLFDVVDVGHAAGNADGTLRPNQILAVGGLPFALLDAERARGVVDEVAKHLWTPLGLRSLAPGEAAYAGRYGGGPRERDSVYHQGTVWPWLIGPFVEAWVRVRGGSDVVKREARERFVAPLLQHIGEAGLGHVSEIADADVPHTPRGCPFQAWSLGELLRLDRQVLVPDSPVRSRHLDERTAQSHLARP